MERFTGKKVAIFEPSPNQSCSEEMTRRICNVTFPLTPALSPGERVNLCRVFGSLRIFRLNPALEMYGRSGLRLTSAALQSSRLEFQKILQNLPAALGENALGMKLHAPDG